MSWITPKTDWKITLSSDEYLGDYFNVSDYNRIKGNIEYLAERAKSLVSVPEVDLGEDKTYTDNYYADEFNALETALDEIADALLKDIGEPMTFFDNGVFIQASELNRIESATLELYKRINDSIEGKAMLAFTLGIPTAEVNF